MSDGEAIGELAIGELTDEGSPVLPPQPVTKRFATHSFVTDADDTPPNTPVPGRILSTFSIRRQITAGDAGRFGPRVEVSFDSEIALANGDRNLDPLLETFSDGREVRLKVGVIVAGMAPSYDSLQDAVVATAGTFTADLDSIRLRLGDQGLLLQDELQTRHYAGTGGREGDLELAGRSKPYAIGKCNNVPAQLIDPAQLIYQVATKYLDFPFMIYDAGIQVPAPSAWPSYSALVAAAVEPGEAAVCLPEACFKLGSPPFGTVTADLRTGYDYETKDTATLIDEILRDAGVPAPGRAISYLSGVDEDEVGFFQAAGQNGSVEDAVSALAGAAGAVLAPDRTGVYRLLWLDVATLDEPPAFSFSDSAILNITQTPPAYGVPWRSWVIGSTRNWTLQTASDLAISAPRARQQLVEREYLEARTFDPVVAQDYHTSRETNLIPSFYSTKNPALNFGNRMAAWYSGGRVLYTVLVKTALCQVDVGDIVHITSARWNLDSGWAGMVVAVNDDLAAVETQITLFG